MSKLYLIGSLRNPEIPAIGQQLRQAGFDVFDDWFAGGPIADDSWRDYEQARGHTYLEALSGYAARHVFDFDYYHLSKADLVVLVLPAGKSGHLEFGWAIGRRKPGHILLDTPDRWDCMYQFATGIHETATGLVTDLERRYSLTGKALICNEDDEGVSPWRPASSTDVWDDDDDGGV